MVQVGNLIELVFNGLSALVDAVMVVAAMMRISASIKEGANVVMAVFMVGMRSRGE